MNCCKNSLCTFSHNGSQSICIVFFCVKNLLVCCNFISASDVWPSLLINSIGKISCSTYLQRVINLRKRYWKTQHSRVSSARKSAEMGVSKVLCFIQNYCCGKCTNSETVNTLNWFLWGRMFECKRSTGGCCCGHQSGRHDIAAIWMLKCCNNHNQPPKRKA